MSRYVRVAAVAAFAAFTLLALGFPRPAAAAGPSCPDLISTQGLSPQVVKVGEQLTLTGMYTDWSSPGSVTAAFRGPGGLSRTEDASNLPDGTYMINVRFGTSDAGHWSVSTTVSEVAGTTTCKAAFDVVAAVLPNTASDPAAATSARARGEQAVPAAVLALAALVATAITGLWVRGRRGNAPPA